MTLYLGCPVWSFKGWVGNFYPEGTKPADFLREYARRLSTIEGNTTFYAMPSQKILAQWTREMPETFLFCPKIPKAISHGGLLKDQVERAQQFADVMSQLGTRLGPMFLQLPPSYAPRLFGDLKSFLEAWPREIRLGVEVRHLDWFEAVQRERLNQLLLDHNMARVIIDTRPIRSLEGDKSIEGSVYASLLEARERKPDVPVFQERTADFVFLRFIGHPELAPNAVYLAEWARYLAVQLQTGADAFVFCHSPDNMAAPYLCRELHRQISKSVDIAPLPWDDADAGKLEQGRLF